VADAAAFTRLLAGFNVVVERVSGSKELRADPFSAQVNAGNVRLVRGAWNRDFMEELRTFPLGHTDDQVDAGSDAFTDLSMTRAGLPVAGGSRPMTAARAGNSHLA
jgi:predicted phage terminase large subunit-like protein